jgi:2,3-bisphosphoglycerate-dependent phosphoglycerate mutase
MKKILHIYLFRHGQTTFNRDKIFTGWKDAKLTKDGVKQAQKIAKTLKNKKIEVAFCTKLSRSKDTLKEVLKFHPFIQVIEDNRMIERSYGDLEGGKHEDFIKKNGEEVFEKIHRGFNVRPPNGESFADVEKRVKSFIKDLKKFIIKNKINVAISAHGNSIRLFRKIWENANKEQAIKWFIPYDKVYDYKIKV